MKHKAQNRRTSLEQTFPHIAAEWHPLKNGIQQPKDFTYGSHHKAWWRCGKGHEWIAVIKNRTVQKQGCPFCSGKRVYNDNSLAAVFPEIAKEWHPKKNAELIPSSVRPGTHKIVWWFCSYGHSWKASVHARTGSKSGCPVCHNLGRAEKYHARALLKKDSIAKSHPNLVADWHPTRNGDRTPVEFVDASNWLAWWRCPKGHEWQARICKRAWGAQGCPFCSNKRVAKDNSLQKISPDLASQWHPTRNKALTPSSVTYRTVRKVWWLCPHGHSWQTSVYARSVRGVSCPSCSGVSTSKIELRVLVELKSIFSRIKWRSRVKGKEVDILLPEQKIAVEVDGYPWHQGKECNDNVKTKHLKCQGYRLIRLRDSRLQPLLLSKDDVVYNDRSFAINDMQSLVTKICRRHRTDRVSSYLQRQDFADDRGYKKIVACLPSPPAGKSLADAHPNLLLEWDNDSNTPLLPTMFSPGSQIKVVWKCVKCGHKWRAAIGSRSGGRGCPWCVNSVLSERRRTASIRKFGSVANNAVLMSLWDVKRNSKLGLAPEGISVQSPTRAWWQCPKGHTWQTEVRNLFRGTRCRACYLEKRVVKP